MAASWDVLLRALDARSMIAENRATFDGATALENVMIALREIIGEIEP